MYFRLHSNSAVVPGVDMNSWCISQNIQRQITARQTDRRFNPAPWRQYKTMVHVPTWFSLLAVIKGCALNIGNLTGWDIAPIHWQIRRGIYCQGMPRIALA